MHGEELGRPSGRSRRGRIPVRLLHAGAGDGRRRAAAREPVAHARRDPARGMSGNLCRCGAYAHIFKAVDRAAELKQAEGGRAWRRRAIATTGTVRPRDAEPAGCSRSRGARRRVVGRPLPRVDAYERVSGSAVFPSDVIAARHAAMARCCGVPHAHALVKAVDTSGAERMPGVRGGHHGDVARGPTSRGSRDALGRRDVAAVRRALPVRGGGGGGGRGRDVLPGAGTPCARFASSTRCSASCPTEDEALEAGAPPRSTREGNRVGEHAAYERGDVEAGFRGGRRRARAEYRTSCEIHTPLEPHGCVARWDGPRLTIWESTQGVYAVQAGVAQALGLPLSSVRVIGPLHGRRLRLQARASASTR